MAVIGPVGSGKSSLLKAFLGEVPGAPLNRPPEHVVPGLRWKMLRENQSSSCIILSQKSFPQLQISGFTEKPRENI